MEVLPVLTETGPAVMEAAHSAPAEDPVSLPPISAQNSPVILGICSKQNTLPKLRLRH